MKTMKMSLANIKGKMTRAEMKNIMAGSGDNKICTCNDGHSAGMVSCGTENSHCNQFCCTDNNYNGVQSCE